jgi:hypothetical protein
VPYFWVKSFAEKTFKRPVFWSGAKMGMLLVLLPVWNLLLLIIAAQFIKLHFLIWLFYFVALNFVAHGFHRFITAYRKRSRLKALSAQNLEQIVEKRGKLIEQLVQLDI